MKYNHRLSRTAGVFQTVEKIIQLYREVVLFCKIAKLSQNRPCVTKKGADVVLNWQSNSHGILLVDRSKQSQHLFRCAIKIAFLFPIISLTVCNLQ